ncbi:MAG: hypothetical protein VX589_19890 [Myxococcota bacterium]|nr:hypothetical protein [Myxococcota bacterium]
MRVFRTFASSVLVLLGVTYAQAEPTIDWSMEPGVIGAEDCVDQLGETRTITVDPTGTNTTTTNTDTTTDDTTADTTDTTIDTTDGLIDTDTGPFTLQLIFYSDSSEDCLTELGDERRPFASTGTSVCGCLTETRESGQFDHSFKFATGDIDTVAALVCDQGSVLTFRARVVYDDVSRDTEESSEITLSVDLTPPQAPGLPIAQAADGAIVVTLEEADRTDSEVFDHEVCVRKKSTSTSTETSDEDAASGTQSITELRAGFADCSARTTKLKNNDEYRFESLDMDVTYEIVVAAYDEAGNRSPNSPIAEATPTALLDFAELYANRVGRYEGEEGGCSTLASTFNSSSLIMFTLIVGPLLARRRRPCGQ